MLLAYSAQNRAVTPRDYEAIIKKIYPDAESMSIVGGEELDPPEFGNVVISISLKVEHLLVILTRSRYYLNLDNTQYLELIKE